MWNSGDAYEPYVGRWSRLVAPRFLDWVGAPPGLRWLDIGCGTGALSQAILGRAMPALVCGIDPSAEFAAHAAQMLTDPRASFAVGDAMSLPFAAGDFDACASGLVLNFVPDAGGALAEMRRVTRGSAAGLVAAYVWDYAGEMQMINRFWSAAVELDPAAAALDEGARFPICHPDRLRRCFEEAGLAEVETTAIDVTCHFMDFDDFWRPFLGGQAPAPSYLATLPEEARVALRESLRKRLPVAADGSIELIARAWAVKGRSA
jgi:SAM-dependent methyltransferase